VGGKQTKITSSRKHELREPVDARELFRGQREIAIRFRGDIYRLRITRNDKLILTK